VIFTVDFHDRSRRQEICRRSDLKWSRGGRISSISTQRGIATTRPAMFRRVFTSSFRSVSLLSRLWNGSNGILAGKHAEQKMISILRNRFPQAQLIEVTDVSGGCGAMFDINVVAPEFKGLNTVKQHRIINEVLKEEIKDMHGLRIYTSIPQS